MKFSTTLLALCVFHPTVWATTAFVVKSPNAVSTKLFISNYMDSLTKPSTAPKQEFKLYDAPAPIAPMSRVAPPAPAPVVKTSPSPLPVESAKDIWKTATPIKVQGGSLRTWSFSDPSVQRIQVLLKTEGRPLNANVELWHGPDNTPQKMAVYLEDGSLRPFNALVETPNGQNALAVRNTGAMEFPIAAAVFEVVSDGTSLGQDATGFKTVQGGAIFTTPFGSTVGGVRVVLKTDGRPMSARIELLQGPSNNKQVMEIYAEDGLTRPFHCVLETPGSGNVVRIVNAATMEYPLMASVEPYSGSSIAPSAIPSAGASRAFAEGSNMSFGSQPSKFFLNAQSAK